MRTDKRSNSYEMDMCSGAVLPGDHLLYGDDQKGEKSRRLGYCSLHD